MCELSKAFEYYMQGAERRKELRRLMDESPRPIFDDEKYKVHEKSRIALRKAAMSMPANDKEESASIEQGLKEAALIHQGKLKGKTFDEFLDEL